MLTFKLFEGSEVSEALRKELNKIKPLEAQAERPDLDAEEAVKPPQERRRKHTQPIDRGDK